MRLQFPPAAGLEQRRAAWHQRCERERFAALIQHAFKSAGSSHTLISDSGLELLRQASQGLPRQAARILRVAMQIGAGKHLNHLPDEVLSQAITELR